MFPNSSLGSGVEFMPETDFVFTVLPAEIDLFAVNLHIAIYDKRPDDRHVVPDHEAARCIEDS